jgi:hypothetical protein
MQISLLYKVLYFYTIIEKISCLYIMVSFQTCSINFMQINNAWTHILKEVILVDLK